MVYFLIPANMAGIPHAMAILLSTFHKYAEKEGNNDTLTKKELSALLHAEIPGTVRQRYLLPLLYRAVNLCLQYAKVLLFPNNSPFSFFLQENSNAEVDSLFSMLDNDKDGVVDFKEFVTFVTALTVLAHTCPK